jgi:hypothetical protein
MRARAAGADAPGAPLPLEPTSPRSGEQHCLVLGPAAVAAATGIGMAEATGMAGGAPPWPPGGGGAGAAAGGVGSLSLGPSREWGLPSIQDEGEEEAAEDGGARQYGAGAARWQAARGGGGGGGDDGGESLIGSGSVYVEEDAATTMVDSTIGLDGAGI